MGWILIVFVLGAAFVGFLAVPYYRGLTGRAPALTVPVSPATGRVEEGHFNVHGKPFACTVCDHTEFSQRAAQLNTAGATLFGLDWANESARCLVCKSCGYVHWFVT